MKVRARNATRLGTGEVFSVETTPLVQYKVMFPSPPVKTFYEHELQRVLLPPGVLVQTRYGTGCITRATSQAGAGLYSYEVDFSTGVPPKVLREDAILRVHRGIDGTLSPVPSHLVDGATIGSFLNAYYFRYCLPTDPRFQAICHGRIDAFPHQMSVIERVLSTYPVRFLLCDEVGLGKTIEALAVVKELALQNIIHRAIIIVPANLVNQWMFELESKFNLDFVMYDGEKVKQLRAAYPGTNPWSVHPRVVTSLHFARREENARALKEISHDLAIFDEAHHLRRYQGTGQSHKKTKSYDLGEIVCRQARFVLLLTATPMQLNPFELFSLVSLLDEALFPKYADFITFKDKIAHFNLVLKNMDRYRRLNIFEQKYTLGMLHELLRGDARFPDDDAIVAALVSHRAGFKDLVFGKMRERHLLSKVMIRNKKRHVLKGFLPRRQTRIVLIEPTRDELEVYTAIRLYITNVYQRALEEKNPATGFVMVTMQRLLASSTQALRKTIEKRINTLREVQVRVLKQRATVEQDAASMTEQEHGAKIAEIEKTLSRIDEDVPLLGEYQRKLGSLSRDSKAGALVDLVRDLIAKEQDVKVIVFTQFIRTLSYLRRVVEASIKGIQTGVFHGQLSKDAKDVEVERFKTSKGAPYVFFSTEAGGEGRNFQFCHVVVNYDLPWNPMKLEQRIGRVDRLGQDHDVQIYNFAMKDTIEEHIVNILSQRILVFQELVGELEPVLIGFEEELQHAILASSSNVGVDVQFKLLDHKLTETLKQVQDHRATMQDLIMEMDSKEFLDDETLACAIELNYYSALEKFARHEASRPGAPVALSPVLDSVLTARAGSREVAGTFNRVSALRSERLDFFNLGHPFIESLIDQALAVDMAGSIGWIIDTTSQVRAAGELSSIAKPGTYLVALNVLDYSGVAARRQLVVEAFKVTGEGCEPAGTLDTGPFLEYLLGAPRIDTPVPGDSETLPWTRFHEENAHLMALLVRERSESWLAENNELHRKMQASEQRYHDFKSKKLRDEIAQYEFLKAEKTTATGDPDPKAVKTLEAKVAKVEEAMLNERDMHAGRMKEIEASFSRAGVSSFMLAVARVKVG